jgi:hypothetical protein
MSQYVPNPAPVPADPPPPKPMFLVLWLLGAALATLVGGAVIGVAASGSESAGVNASYFVAGPVGFFWGAAVGALIAHFGLKKKLTARRAAPVGCGCGCAVFLVIGLIVFMTAIFPAL